MTPSAYDAAFAAAGLANRVEGASVNTMTRISLAALTVAELEAENAIPEGCYDDLLDLVGFCYILQDHRCSWQPVIQEGIKTGQIDRDYTKPGKLATEILMMVVGCCMIYALLFGVGYFIYGQTTSMYVCFAVFFISVFLMRRFWSQIH